MIRPHNKHESRVTDMMTGFFKGVGMGMVAGVAITMAVVPVDRRRMMKSPVGKTMKTVCGVYEGIKDAF